MSYVYANGIFVMEDADGVRIERRIFSYAPFPSWGAAVDRWRWGWQGAAGGPFWPPDVRVCGAVYGDPAYAVATLWNPDNAHERLALLVCDPKDAP